jgi:hypothetical protein
MVRIDPKRKLLAVQDVLISLNPDTKPKAVSHTFRKFIRTSSDLPRVHLLFKENSLQHTHTFPAISTKDRPKPQLVVTSYTELHDFLSEYNSLHPKAAERINAFLDENREQLQGIWGPEPKSCFALKTTVFPSQPHHVLQAFRHFGTIPLQGSTPGLWKAVIPAALLHVLVEKIGLCTDVAFLRKSSNLGEEASLDEEGNHLHAYYRCYRRDHVTQVDVNVTPVGKKLKEIHTIHQQVPTAHRRNPRQHPGAQPAGQHRAHRKSLSNGLRKRGSIRIRAPQVA